MGTLDTAPHVADASEIAPESATSDMATDVLSFAGALTSAEASEHEVGLSV